MSDTEKEMKSILANLAAETRTAAIDACIDVISNYRVHRINHDGGNGPSEVLSEAIDLLRTLKAECQDHAHGGAGGGDDDTPQCQASYPGIPGTCIFAIGPQHPDHHQAPDGWRWRGPEPEIVIWAGVPHRRRHCPPHDECPACQRLGYHLEPVSQ